MDDRQDFLSGGVDQLIRNNELQHYVLLAPKPLWKTGVLRYNHNWRNAWCEDAVWALVTEMLRRLGPENVDPTRLYATGLSLGAIGVWHLALRYGEYLAGIVPVSGKCEWPFKSWYQGRLDPAVAKRLEQIPVRCYQIDADRYGGTPIHDLEWLCWGLPETTREVTLKGMDVGRSVDVKIRSWERPNGAGNWELWEAKGPLTDWAYYDDWGGDKHCLWNRVYPFVDWGMPEFLASHSVPKDR